jgi:hypothetical protein
MSREIEIAAAVIIDAAESLGIDLKAAIVEMEKQRVAKEALDDDLAPRRNEKFRIFTLRAISDPRYGELPDRKYRNAIMKAKARVAHCFTRNITNEHSDADAVKILFETNHGAGGSGWLDEYVGPALDRYRAKQKTLRRKATSKSIDA